MYPAFCKISATVIILSGSGKIRDAQDEVVGIAGGDTVLIPAAYEGAITFDAETQYLTITV